jgi:hypothetical protein
MEHESFADCLEDEQLSKTKVAYLEQESEPAVLDNRERDELHVCECGTKVLHEFREEGGEIVLANTRRAYR